MWRQDDPIKNPLPWRPPSPCVSGEASELRPAAPENSGTNLHPQLFRRNSVFQDKVDPVALGQECSSVMEQVLRAEDLGTQNLLDRISFTLNELERSGSWSSCAAPLGETPPRRSAGHVASSSAPPGRGEPGVRVNQEARGRPGRRSRGSGPGTPRVTGCSKPERDR